MHRISRQTCYTILNLTVLAALLVFIFGNSLQPRAASTRQSLGTLAVLTELLNRLTGHSNLTEHFVRKLAHFSEFAALGFFTIHLCAVRLRVQWHFVLHSLFFGLVCAVTDESLQLLSDRSAQVPDVLLDFSGVLCGTAVFLLLYAVRHRRTLLSHFFPRH